jgi:SAM-dependent methyltransferase
MEPKDLFSVHSKKYATFRPTYPAALYEFIFRYVPNKDRVWDCATGNGQVARFLSTCFKEVQATDISQMQIDQAYQAPNIVYSIGPAERTSFPSEHFDLITVGQALHWFNHPEFYKEVKRVGKPGAILAAWGYAMIFVSPPINRIILDVYTNIAGPYWDEARRMVEREYKTFDFPFAEIPTPPFAIDVVWSLEHLLGYIESWSAMQKYMLATGINPMAGIGERFKAHWKPGEMKKGRFPVFLRMGKVA